MKIHEIEPRGFEKGKKSFKIDSKAPEIQENSWKWT